MPFRLSTTYLVNLHALVCAVALFIMPICQTQRIVPYTYEHMCCLIRSGLLLTSVSQYVYLFKFFMWEIGYLRSIDIIVDRAGWEIQWGCLVFVPSV